MKWRPDCYAVQVVAAVAGACSQICAHLSEPLYDLVLNMVFDYASTNVRSNAVRAIHQLVECVANANPAKTLAKFLPLCIHHIRTELEHGASSVRTTSSSSPLPSDATLHWCLYPFNLATLATAQVFFHRPSYPSRLHIQVSLAVSLYWNLTVEPYRVAMVKL
jgi:hypothetical protein